MKNTIVSYFRNITYLLPLVLFTGCGCLPQVLSEAENIVDDDAIKITVSREALGRQTNVKASIELDNGQLQIPK